MGLFTNKKKLCPICGNPTPRLLPTKIEDQPICKECDKKIDLPIGAVNNMSLYEFKEYLAAYEENQALWPVFNATYRYCFGFTSDSVLLDENNGLIRLRNNGSGWVIEKKYLKSFRILEDDKPLYENGSGTLNSYPSDIPNLVEAMAPSIARFRIERQEYERMENRERMRRLSDETDEERRERERTARMYRPRFEAPSLFHGFRIEIAFDHPYWPSFETTINAPTFDEDYPSIDSYMKSYREAADELHVFATKLMHLIDPAAGETRIGTAAAHTEYSAPAAPADAVAEIKKYKELLDQGLITEEEFSAKKRQLLGI